ncbi:MAG: dihydroxyacetone kinase subunit DhaK [Alphaproteobacteria bacterium]|nr:dihydroxyacetone kinase subunit DhaK [Alphaproteobacteria bacterium]MBU0832112.1 dihydroxyacetone kinase subunit DhaK [Alphaproteobacteria bacterium]MBU1769928.1 dihydroxyacetone kinase subunit DhaK [Alphaproteobacteria bacterium]
MKKLINAPDAVTSDMLSALARSDNRLLIEPDHGIVLRADYLAHRESGKVALISGGGSGHEPAHAGYVGKGMLTAAVAGEVFTSPSVDAVLAAIRLVTGPAGCLLIVKNYTGDRLNFGVAAAIARGEGLNVAMVLVDDDIAIPAGKSRAGARGLAGTVLVHKVAGASAEAGTSLDALAAEVQTFVPQIGTMGIGLSACTVPAAGKPSFVLGDGEVEYGLGIHGEPGVSREPIDTADAIAARLVGAIVAAKQIPAGKPVVLLVNGLGGTPPAELAIVAGSAVAACGAHGLHVRRLLVGSFLTAIEMAGCSITLATASDALIERLEASTEASAWLPVLTPSDASRTVTPPPPAAALGGTTGPAADPAAQKIFDAAIRSVAKALIEAEPMLTALDAKVGDGDLGISMMRGAQAVLGVIDTLDLAHPAAALEQVSSLLRRNVGGTSGPLYAAFSLAVALSLRDDGGALALADWARAFDSGCRAVMDLGGAGKGDRTMLDALLPAAEALAKAASEGVSAGEGLSRAVQAARAGTNETARLDPRFGRSSYVGDRAIGHVDPGAEAVTIWLGALPGIFVNQ